MRPSDALAHAVEPVPEPHVEYAPPGPVDPPPSDLDSANISTWRKLPRRAWPTLVALAVGPLAAYHAARADGDDSARAAAAHEFLGLPKTHLRLAQKGNFRKRLGHLLAHRPTPVTTSTSTPDPLGDKRATAKATALFRQGLRKAAIKSLAREATSDEAPTGHVDELRRLHPSGPAPPRLAVRNSRRIVVDPETVCETTKKLLSQAAPGPDGWTGELLDVLTSDPVCVTGLADLLSDIANNDVPPCVADRLRACRLIAIPKPTGGIRPIAMGSALIKLASTIVMEQHRDVLEAHFFPIQFGVLRAGGAESAIHTVRAAMTPDCVVATLDAANAFNVPDRVAIADAVSDHKFAFAHRLFDFEYGVASKLYGPNDVTLASTRGVRQGSVLGGLFFALAIHPMLSRASSRFSNVRIVAYLDDITLVGPANAVRDAARYIEEELNAIGIALNHAKCEWLGDSRPDGFSAPSIDGGIKVLGACVTQQNSDASRPRQCDVTKSWLMKRTESRHVDFWRRLLVVAPDVCIGLLSAAGIPQIFFLLRTHAAVDTQAAASRFEERVRGILTTTLDAHIDDVSRILLHLPVVMGGIGITDVTKIAPIAAAASLAEANGGRRGTQRVQTASFNAELAKSVCDADRDIAPRLAANCSARLFFLRDPELLGALSGKLFAAAIRFLVGMRRRTLPAFIVCDGCRLGLPTAQWANHVAGCTRRRGCNASTRHAALKDTLKLICRDNGTTCEAHEPRDLGLSKCPGCRLRGTTAHINSHMKLCAHVSALDRQRGVAELCGPDIRAYLRGDHVATLIDVTVVDPCAPSHIGRKIPALFSEVEARKNSAYRTATMASGARFTTFAVTAQGALSELAISFLRDAVGGSQANLSLAAAAVSAATLAASARALLSAEAFYSNGCLAVDSAADARVHTRDVVDPVRAFYPAPSLPNLFSSSTPTPAPRDVNVATPARRANDPYAANVFAPPLPSAALARSFTDESAASSAVGARNAALRSHPSPALPCVVGVAAPPRRAHLDNDGDSDSDVDSAEPPRGATHVAPAARCSIAPIHINNRCAAFAPSAAPRPATTPASPGNLVDDVAACFAARSRGNGGSRIIPEALLSLHGGSDSASVIREVLRRAARFFIGRLIDATPVSAPFSAVALSTLVLARRFASCGKLRLVVALLIASTLEFYFGDALHTATFYITSKRFYFILSAQRLAVRTIIFGVYGFFSTLSYVSSSVLLAPFDALIAASDFGSDFSNGFSLALAGSTGLIELAPFNSSMALVSNRSFAFSFGASLGGAALGIRNLPVTALAALAKHHEIVRLFVVIAPGMFSKNPFMLLLLAVGLLITLSGPPDDFHGML